ncbi:HU family DNA-binding protein [Streptomyces sp. TLI_171]|uniref:HU family DNA-binding protein n=1 Tax=Streptomyces sp. TLI_171 TaxID=1938859 RepID=UPI000C186368|nr:HU family DNA-binding protein [Streptomyces sp. TLI_171]RKE17216.1 DNA-binding protein HU-beta [Streptomyces sp. TLI_171]
MNKGQLVEAVAGKLGSRVAAEEAVDAVLDVMVRAVVAGERVSVTGFGTLEPVERAARTSRNPRTGERVRVKKTTVPRFRAGQGFKDLVSGTKKLPKDGPSVAKAPKGSLTAGRARPAGSRATVAAKPSTAKKSTAKTAPAKTATVKKVTAKKGAAGQKATAPARKRATTATARKTAPGVGRKTAPAKRATRRATA